MLIPQNLILVSPSLLWEHQYQETVREFLTTGEEHFNNFPLALDDFAAFLAELEDEAAGSNLPPGIFPQRTYWTVTEGKTLVGEIRLRPTIPPPYEAQNGHIGYNVRPSERRKGYATRQLRLILEEARHCGLQRVMLPVRAGNVGSERAIEKNGGYAEGQDRDSETGEVTRYYWIDLDK